MFSIINIKICLPLFSKTVQSKNLRVGFVTVSTGQKDSKKEKETFLFSFAGVFSCHFKSLSQAISAKGQQRHGGLHSHDSSTDSKKSTNTDTNTDQGTNTARRWFQDGLLFT